MRITEIIIAALVGFCVTLAITPSNARPMDNTTCTTTCNGNYCTTTCN